MKKMLTLGLVLAMVMMFSVGVMADPLPPEYPGGYPAPTFETGVGIFENHAEVIGFFEDDTALDASKYYNVEGLNLTAGPNTISYDAGDQFTNVEIPVLANIPCYIEMTLVGNAGYTKAKSLGAGQGGTVDWSGEGHYMLFDSRHGGFMDENWNHLGQGVIDEVFSTVNPTNDVYINACDIWRANLYSNLDYALDVKATKLESGDEDLLISMRFTEESNNWSNPTVELAHNVEERVGDWLATEFAEVFMQFRVPFTADQVAGQYSGTITFIAQTI